MISAHGTTITMNGTAIPELGNVTLPSLDRPVMERTRHADVDDEYWTDIRRYGQLVFDIGFVPGDPVHTALLEAWANASEDTYVVTVPEGPPWRLQGFVCGFQPGAPVDGLLRVTVNVQPSRGVNIRGLDYLLLESGDYLLQENSGRIYL
jgi:hypothetical protein